MLSKLLDMVGGRVAREASSQDLVGRNMKCPKPEAVISSSHGTSEAVKGGRKTKTRVVPPPQAERMRLRLLEF